MITLKGSVVGIESGATYTDKQRRIIVKFEGCAIGMDRLKVREDAVGIVGLALDDALNVTVWPTIRARTAEEILLAHARRRAWDTPDGQLAPPDAADATDADNFARQVPGHLGGRLTADEVVERAASRTRPDEKGKW